MRELVLLTLALTVACRGRPPVDPAARPTSVPGRPGSSMLPVDAVQVYRQMGLLADGAGTPFVGRLGFLAGPGDSTYLLLTLSIPSRSLVFHREGDGYRASYRVAMDLRRSGSSIRQITANETVRVPTFKETTRSDESIIFQQLFTVAPGPHLLQVTVAGEDPSRTGEPLIAEINVPALTSRGLSTPIAYYSVTPRTSRDSLPHVIPTPRGTVVFGRDSTLPVYVEAYGATTERLALGVGVIGEHRLALWTDSAVVLTRHGPGLHSGTINVPVPPLGIGVTTLSVWRYDRPDTVHAPIFITFGEELPVATMDQMLAYLRYYASPSRLRAMRDTTPRERARLWAAFLAETDPNAQTPEHEGLRDYFQRIYVANARFRDEGGPGWLTERGMVYVTLGEPDQIIEPTGQMNERGRIQVWEYRQQRLFLQFVDQSGFGRWRLTPSSQSEFMAAARRVQVG